MSARFHRALGAVLAFALLAAGVVIPVGSAATSTLSPTNVLACWSAVPGHGMSMAVDWAPPSSLPGTVTSYIVTAVDSEYVATIHAPSQRPGISPANCWSPVAGLQVIVVANRADGSQSVADPLYLQPGLQYSTGAYNTQVFNVSGMGPTAVGAQAGVSSATVSWGTPSQIVKQISSYYVAFFPTGYTVTASPGGKTCKTKMYMNEDHAASCIVKGLTNGTSYSLTVKSTSVNAAMEASATFQTQS
ncbi:MAG: fibronectin type III domain-containing protein [Candidatus Nanopelagicales bacterium]